MKLLIVVLVFLLTACAGTRLETLPDHVGIRVASTPEVKHDGVRVLLWFDLPTDDRESIQRLTFTSRPGWEGVETHRQPMWVPDFQIATFSSTPWYVERVNTVAPGRTQGCPWATLPSMFKGVCMISGWFGSDGRPVGNALYFQLGGKQGGKIVHEQHALATTYRLQGWSADHPENPMPGYSFLRITCVDTGHFLEFNQ